MNTEDIAKKVASPWHPETNPKRLRLLGKLGEELGECVSAVCRAIIQKLEEAHPTTGKPNRQWLEEELADVYASADLVVERLNLNVEHIMERAAAKKRYLITWHDEA